MPHIVLGSTAGGRVDLQEASQELAVFFFYPRTGRPEEAAPEGWDLIPGARGCTPQSCGFRDLYDEFRDLGVGVFGVSTQTTAFQQELVGRIHLPFEVLSDAHFELTDAMRLPTFSYTGMRLLKRMAWVVAKGRIEKVFYPVFPPDRNADEVLSYLRSRLEAVLLA